MPLTRISPSSRNEIKRVIFKTIQETDFLTTDNSTDLLIIPLPSCTRETDFRHVIIRELKELISKL